MKKNKKIIFEEGSLAAKYLLDIPKPATNSVPQWFKNDKNFSNGSNNEIEMLKKQSEATYKMCVPVTDSLTAGYNILLPAAIYVTNAGDENNYVPNLHWQVTWPLCDVKPADILQSYPIPHDHSSIFFRWTVDWKITTPKDYSLWITHPAHRYDLPFTTINGFVDTDKHPNPLVLPFFVRNGFEGKIEEGTPIAQIIPIKRDEWKSEKAPLDQKTLWSAQNNMKLDYLRGYKKRYWTKKRYT
jgi:hypothetical protein